MTIKLEIFDGYSLAFDNGKQFAVGSEDREQDMVLHCKMVAEKQETNFVIMRHNTAQKPATIKDTPQGCGIL